MITIVKNHLILIDIMHLIVILLLFSALCSPILCQNKKYAIVSNNGLNGKSDRNKIEFLTTLLKKESSTNGIIILGDVVSTHSLDDLGEFQSFISENNFNIKIIPGYNDYSSNILSPYLIKQELNEQFFLVKDQNSILLGYSSVIPFIKSAGYIDIETLNYLNEECKSIKDKLIYSFSNLPLSKVINKASLIKEIGNNKIIHFYPEENKFVVKNDFVLEIGFPGADKNNKPIYHLVENKNDSIFVIKKYFENEKNE